MYHQKQTVVVKANFRQEDALFSYIKRYAQYADEDFVYWDEFAFTTQHLHEPDALLVFNQPSSPITICCDAGKTIAMMMEPGNKQHHPWMYRGVHQYANVYSPVAHHTPNSKNKNVASHGYAGWFTEYEWPALVEMDVPLKTKSMSCISSDLMHFAGHKKRFHFVNETRRQLPSIDFFGRGICFLEDKMDGLLNYRYSIAIENSSQPFYFTDKINDCFLAYTVPLYYGCTNISKFFPAKSFVEIDIDHPRKAWQQIEKFLYEDDWSDRLSALREARELVLNQYQPLAGAAAILRGIAASPKKNIYIAPIAPGLRKRLGDAWFRFKQKRQQPAQARVWPVSKTV